MPAVLHTPAVSHPARAADEDVSLYEYTSAANPIGAKLIPAVPYRSFLPALYAEGSTRAVPLDLSRELSTEGPATGPGLCASFLRVLPKETLTLEPEATSIVLYVIQGHGCIVHGDGEIAYSAGAFIALPGGTPARIVADALSTLYCVDDEPLLRYLGAIAATPRFRPTYYPPERAQAELRRIAGEPEAARRSRISVLLGNESFPQTRTVTHTLWAMYGLLPTHAEQKPHRHQSIALDFIVQAAPGCYTLVGTELDAQGRIARPERVDWVSGMAFVTPPGHWHAHYNESGEEALLIPIQDAGLQTHLRSLDIRFQA